MARLAAPAGVATIIYFDFDRSDIRPEYAALINSHARHLAGAGAGMIGKGIGGPVADYLNGYLPGMGYFAIFAAYALLFALSVVTLRWVRKVKE